MHRKWQNWRQTGWNVNENIETEAEVRRSRCEEQWKVKEALGLGKRRHEWEQETGSGLTTKPTFFSGSVEEAESDSTLSWLVSSCATSLTDDVESSFNFLASCSSSSSAGRFSGVIFLRLQEKLPWAARHYTSGNSPASDLLHVWLGEAHLFCD